ncbi:MAG: RNA-binding protein [Isosphaeraceae bacterium]|nr:RNA-binding protein [Isosphaeraceae bacterium]
MRRRSITDPGPHRLGRGRVIEPYQERRERSAQETQPAMMIYVGNLDYQVTSAELRQLFEEFGSVAMAEVQTKARTGQSRGFGLVEMLDHKEARNAIEALNGRAFQDRALVVNESRPRRTVRDLYTGGGWFGSGS